MIHYLEGKVSNIEQGTVLVRANGPTPIGFLVTITDTKVGSVPLAVGENVELYIHPVIRDDRFEYFGFFSAQEKRFFLTLLGVSGIGPKAALVLLRSVGLDRLVRAIIDQDKSALSGIPGVGKKTIEKMLIDLNEKVQKEIAEGSFTQVGTGGAQLSLSKGNTKEVSLPVNVKDAVVALTGLGYRQADALRAIEISRQNIEEPIETIKPEEIIKLALREI